MAQHKIRQALRRAAAATLKKQQNRNHDRFELASHTPVFAVLPLESRMMMSVAAGTENVPHEGTDAYGTWEALVLPPELIATLNQQSGGGGSGGGTTTSNEPAAAMTGAAIPALQSRPSAVAKIYLDFDGDVTSSWGSYAPGTTPAFDLDGNTTNFTTGEITAITEIWSRVAEKYSPFNIDVTTVNPGNINSAQRLVFGGSGSWAGGTYGGIMYIGAFADAGSNTGFVFTSNFGGQLYMMGDSAAHEAGHGFGLNHQQQLDSNGNVTGEYNRGNGVIAPIMGTSYWAQRGIWYNGQADDLSVLTASYNGFGYRADDYGNTTTTATAVTTSNGSFNISGVIERMTDADFFSFTTGGGQVNFTGSVAQYAAMLDMKMELRSSSGGIIASADTASLGETLSLNLNAGSYYITVASHGSYGDLGQYTLTMNTVAAAPPSAPTGLSSGVNNSLVTLGWTDTSNNESGFKIERSADSGGTWTNAGSVGANATSFQETMPTGTTWTYRVMAYNSAGNSTYSNTTSVFNPVPVTPPGAPSNLNGSLSNSVVSLTWSDNSGNETGFKVHRSTDSGATWTVAGEVAANTTTFAESIPQGATWSYRVVSYNTAYMSDPSNIVTINNPRPVTPPSAPSNVSGSVMDFLGTLTWTDNSDNETGFKIQRTEDGGTTWTDLATTDANVNHYDDWIWMGQAFGYRVQAVNSLYSSSFTSPGWMMNPMPTTVPAAPANVTATISSDGTASVDWEAGSHDLIGYNVERTEDGGATWTTVHQVIAGNYGFDETLPVGVTASYRVSAFNPVGNSPKSRVATVTRPLPVQPPTSPTNLAIATTGVDRIDIVWTGSATANSYIVERSLSAGSGWAQIATTTATVFSDTGLSSATTYYYRVTAVNSGGTSSPTGSVSATTGTPTVVVAPNAPTNLSVSVNNRGKITLNWNDNANNEQGFYIERSTDGQNWDTVGTTAADVTTDSSTPYRKTKTTFWFRVRAFNAAGVSAYSNTVSMTVGPSTSSTSTAAPSTVTSRRSAQLMLFNPVFARVTGKQLTILRLMSGLN